MNLDVRIEQVENGYVIHDHSHSPHGTMGRQYVAKNIAELAEVVKTLAASEVKSRQEQLAHGGT